MQGSRSMKLTNGPIKTKCRDLMCIAQLMQARHFIALSLRSRSPREPEAVSVSFLSNNRKTAQPYRCRVSGATGANDYTPTPHEWNKNSQSNYKTTE